MTMVLVGTPMAEIERSKRERERDESENHKDNRGRYVPKIC